MLHIFIEVLFESIKLIPFLFLAYLLIEYIEHNHSKKIENILLKSGKFGSLIGSILGIIPQCGISAFASNLYAGRVITIGTLFAVFIATSDEAIPIMLSHPESYGVLIKLIIVKFVLAFIIGTIIDLIFKKKIEVKEHLHINKMCKDCDCEHNGILKSSILHTLQIFVFIFIFSFILHSAFHYIDRKTLESLLLNGNIFQPIIASIIGIIPNCAASVILTELFLEGVISFGSIVAGLCTNAGVGLLVLFKANKDVKENIKISLSLFGISSIIGIILQILNI